MQSFCPNCEVVCPVHLEQAVETLEVRDVPISVDVTFLRCDVCGTDFDSPEHGDPLEVAFRKYRSQHGLIQPEQIHTFRKKYGLTQQELSHLLGWGGATLSRYENGALQDAAHDRALSMIMEPGNLLSLLRQHPNALSPEKFKAVESIIQSDSSISSEMSEFIENRLTSDTRDELNGYKKFSPGKFVNTVLYFCFNLKPPKTKLNKLLWYADFKHFKDNIISITGAQYAHCPHGPTPDKFDSLYAYIVDGLKAVHTEERERKDFLWEVLVAAIPPDMNVFSQSELRTLVTVNERFKDFTATEIREFSHEEEAYKSTVDGQIISYALADTLQI